MSRDSNLGLVDWVEDYLAGHGIAAHRDLDATGQKASLYAHVGPETGGGVILSGHTDVVPVDGQAWVTDPFTVTEKDGKLFGRGTCDMKGFDALAIWAAVEAQRRGVKRPLQLVPCRATRKSVRSARPPMIEAMQPTCPRRELAIIGEPDQKTGAIVNAQRAGSRFDLHFHRLRGAFLHRYTGVPRPIMEGALPDRSGRNAHERGGRGRGNPANAYEPALTSRMWQ